MEDDTPSKYPISVDVTSLTETSPVLSDTKAREAVKSAILLNAIAADDLMSAFAILVIVLIYCIEIEKIRNPRPKKI